MNHHEGSRTETLLSAAEDQIGESPLRIAIENSPQAVAMFDKNMCYVLASRRWLADYGLEGTNVVGRSHYEIFPDLPPEWIRFHRRGMQGEVLRRDEDLFVMSNGTRYWLRWELRPWFTADREIGGILIYSEDITSRKLAEFALKESEQAFRETFDLAPVGIAHVAPDGHWLRVNRAICEITGYTESEILKKAFADITHPEDLEADLENVQRLMKGEFSRYSMEKRYLRPDRSIVWVNLTVSLKRHDDGRPDYFITCIENITEKKRVEVEKAERQGMLMSIVVNSPSALSLKDRDGRYTIANPNYDRVLGRSGEAMIGKTDDELFPPEIARALRRNDERVFHTLDRLSVEEQLPTADGQLRDFMAHKFPIFDSKGEAKWVCSISLDITEKKKAEAAIAESETRFRQLAEFIPLILWIAKPDGNVEYYNSRYYEYTGLTPEQARDWGWKTVVHPEDLERSVREWTHAVNTGEFFQTELRFRRARDGQQRWHLIRALPLRDQYGKTRNWLGTCTDIHDQKQLIEDLELSRARLSIATASAEIGIWETNLHDGMTTVSEIEQKIFELPDSRVSADQLFARIHPEDLEAMMRLLAEAIEEKKDYVQDFRITKRDGSIAWLYGHAKAVYADDGEPLRMYGVNIDITERRIIEERLREAVKKANEANELKSAFLANMSHEIRTPLGAILGFTELLQDPLLSAEERASYQVIVRKNGEQLSSLVNDILDLSKVEAGQLRAETVATEVSGLVQDVISTLSAKASEKGLQLKVSISRDVPSMIGTDPLRLKQILINIIGNAIKFTAKGSVTVRVEMAAAEKVRFTIADTGIGISAADRQQLFRPFSQVDVSNTRRYGGTGLGLVLSRRIALLLGGDLVLKSSEVGQGSVFEFTIAARKPVEAATCEPEHFRPSPGPSLLGDARALAGLRVLLVEDSPDNQMLISRILKKHGAQVEVAENGRVGVEKATSLPVDVVVMDIQMPVMDGFTATYTLRAQGFQKPIVALTAHAMPEVRAKTLHVGCTDHLTKPVRAEELIALLSRFLPVKPQVET